LGLAPPLAAEIPFQFSFASARLRKIRFIFAKKKRKETLRLGFFWLPKRKEKKYFAFGCQKEN
jgi:hypothetical protein